MNERDVNPGADISNGGDGPLVLVIEEDPALLRLNRRVLTIAGFQVVTATSGKDGLALAVERRPDVVCLDLGSRGSGEVLSDFKDGLHLMVVAITSWTEEDLLLDCLARGADDILTRPYLPDDLEDAVRALVRIQQREPTQEAVIQVGELEIDAPRWTVARGGEPLPFSHTEWRFLRVLLAQKGRPVLHKELLSKALGPSLQDHIKLLHAWMTRLREKLEGPRPSTPLIADFLGVGYVFAPETL